MHPEQMSMAAEFKEKQVKTRTNKITRRREDMFYGLE